VEAQAEAVRKIFAWYTQALWSIGAIARQLNQEQIPTRLGQAAQSCLSRQRLLWENGDLRAAEDYTALAAKRSLLAALQQQPRKGAQPVD
jgi:hypothetical protein